MKRFFFILAIAFSVTSCFNFQNSDSDGSIQIHKAVLVNLTSNIETSGHSALMGLHVAQKALRNEMNATVFVNVDGVSIFAPGAEKAMCHGENFHAILSDIMEKGGEVVCCKHCLNSAGLSKSNLINGASISEEQELIETLSSEVVCLTY